MSQKIENLQSEIQQLENRKKLLLQQHKAQERKARTKRLCKRAGLFESMLPGSVQLSDEQFKAFLEKVLLAESSINTLMEIQFGQTIPNPVTAAS
jgi:hypothetical protein